MTWGMTAIAGASVVGSVIGAKSAGSAANKQIQASERAAEQQYAAAQEAIATQKGVLESQLAGATGVRREQIQAQYDALNNQLRTAAETRDAQLGVATQVRGEQLGLSKNVLDMQQGAYNPYQEAGLAGQNRLREYLGIGGDTGAQGYGQYANAQFTPEAFAAGQDPGYAFRMKEGLKAVDAQAAARGGLISGAALKASQRFGQDMASQEYQNAFNRYQTSRQNTLAPYQSLQGVGMGAAGGLANAAGTYGQTSGNALGTYGAQAIGAYGNFGQTAGSAYGNFGNQQSGIIGNQGDKMFNAYGGYGNQVTGALTGYGNNQANLTTGAGNAAASGDIGQANAISGGISNLSNQYYQNQLLNMFRNKNTNDQLISQYGRGNVFTPSGGGYVPSGVSDYAF